MVTGSICVNPPSPLPQLYYCGCALYTDDKHQIPVKMGLLSWLKHVLCMVLNTSLKQPFQGGVQELQTYQFY